MRLKFPNIRQSESKDCGPTCLKIIAKYHGRSVLIEQLRIWCSTSMEGTSLGGLCAGAERIGFRPVAVRTDLEVLESENIFPCIAHWKNNHFVVIYKVTKKHVFISDPAQGLKKLLKDEFVSNWSSSKSVENNDTGIILMLHTTSDFYNPRENKEEFAEGQKRSVSSFLNYGLKYKRYLLQLVFGLLAATLIQAFIPFITQSVVDVGIQNQDVDFIYLVFLSQLLLYLGSTFLEIIQGWIFLHLNTRINISLLSDFFIKLMRLPISYFDVRKTGDILQRINDHRRIEKLLTNESLAILFSFVNMLVFGVILGIYNLKILAVFVFGSMAYFLWIVLFLKKRKEIDERKFSVSSMNSSKVIELINGMQEIKLHNAERHKRWGWENIQVKSFRVAIQGLTINQIQGIGSSFISQIKNLSISFITANLVIEGQLTIGMMLSISYIIGQLNGPVSRIIGFINTLQDAKLSLDRINEIYGVKDELQASSKSIEFDMTKNIELKNLSFKYPGSGNDTLTNLNLTIPSGKTTAIVGMSGSGKTTLLKLLLKFHKINLGSVKIGGLNLNDLSFQKWRDNCGVVMQEGFIFNDTISKNISMSESVLDKNRLMDAIRKANLESYVNSLSNGVNTLIGLEGVTMSTGQKQRMLIARAIYKNPQLFFLDEATSALDAENEKTIMNNLEDILKNKTAVVIAHRLSTVKNADQIVVLEKGSVKEVGTHKSLISKKGSYFNLIKNQLELA